MARLKLRPSMGVTAINLQNALLMILMGVYNRYFSTTNLLIKFDYLHISDSKNEVEHHTS